MYRETKRAKRIRKVRETRDRRYALQFWYELPSSEPVRVNAVEWRSENLIVQRLRGERIESKRRKH